MKTRLEERADQILGTPKSRVERVRPASRSDDRVRLFTRRGYDWTKRFPRVVDALRRMKVSSITLDGEAVVSGADGVSDFNALHSQRCDEMVFLYAFDLLAARTTGENL